MTTITDYDKAQGDVVDDQPCRLDSSKASIILAMSSRMTPATAKLTLFDSSNQEIGQRDVRQRRLRTMDPNVPGDDYNSLLGDDDPDDDRMIRWANLN